MAISFFCSDKEKLVWDSTASLSVKKQEIAAATMPMSQEASNYDEVSMQQSMLFSDGLKVELNMQKLAYGCLFALLLFVFDHFFKSPSELERAWRVFNCVKLMEVMTVSDSQEPSIVTNLQSSFLTRNVYEMLSASFFLRTWRICERSCTQQLSISNYLTQQTIKRRCEFGF